MVSKNAIQRKHCVDEKLKDIKNIMIENNTVRLRGIGTELIGTILIRASVPLSKIGTDLLGSWWPQQCVLPTLTS